MNIVTSTNILCERINSCYIPVEDSIGMCAKAGYRELDLCFVDLVNQNTDFLKDNWKEYVAGLGMLAQKLGISFVQAHAPIHDFCRNPEQGKWMEELVKRSIEGAGLLGIPWIVIHPSTGVEGRRISGDTHAKNVAYFSEMADYAAKFGVGIAIENMWGTTKEGIARYAIRAEELNNLIKEIGKKNVGACWDTEHCGIEGNSQTQSIRLLGKSIKATHISDQTAHNNIHILPYTGFTDWDEVLGAFGEIGYDGVFAFEIQHYLLAMPKELLPEAVIFSRRVGEEMIGKMERLKAARGEVL